MKYKETRTLSAEDLRNLCIKNHWYTKGTCEEYSHLLYDLAENKEHLTTDDIIEIAEDIVAHSEIDDDSIEDISIVACLVNRACEVLFYEKVRDDLSLATCPLDE